MQRGHAAGTSWIQRAARVLRSTHGLAQDDLAGTRAASVRENATAPPTFAGAACTALHNATTTTIRLLVGFADVKCVDTGGDACMHAITQVSQHNFAWRIMQTIGAQRAGGLCGH